MDSGLNTGASCGFPALGPPQSRQGRSSRRGSRWIWPADICGEKDAQGVPGSSQDGGWMW